METDLWTGISHYVIVEANDEAQANRRARDVGIYFDGVWNGPDCDCCGDRWSRVSDWDEAVVPSIYGQAVHDSNATTHKYMAEGPEGFIHYLDGRIEAFYTAVDSSTWDISPLRVVPWSDGEALAA